MLGNRVGFSIPNDSFRTGISDNGEQNRSMFAPILRIGIPYIFSVACYLAQALYLGSQF